MILGMKDSFFGIKVSSPKRLRVFLLTAMLLTSSAVIVGDIQHWRANSLIDQAWKNMGTVDRTKNTEQLQQAESISFKNSRIWSRLCGAYRVLEDYDLAIHACKQQIKISQSDDSWFGLGIVYWDMKDYGNAASAFEHASNNSNFDIVHNYFIYSLLLSKQYEKAIPPAQKYLEIWKAHPTDEVDVDSVRHMLAIAYDGAGRAEKAQEIYRLDHIRSCHAMDPPHIEGGGKGLFVPCEHDKDWKPPADSLSAISAR
jgi:tetratricopeptide (TPR) repeat protein